MRPEVAFIRGEAAKQEPVGALVAVAAGAEAGPVSAVHDLAADNAAVVTEDDEVADVAHLNRAGFANP